jgi:hypothetical protein
MKRHLLPTEYRKRIKLWKDVEFDDGPKHQNSVETLCTIVDSLLPPVVLLYHRKELLQVPSTDPYFSMVYSVIGNYSEPRWEEDLCAQDLQDLNEPDPNHLKQSQRRRLLFVLLDDAPKDFNVGTVDEFMDGDLPLSAGEMLFLNKEKVGLWRKYAVKPGESVEAGPYFPLKTYFK